MEHKRYITTSLKEIIIRIDYSKNAMRKSPRKRKSVVRLTYDDRGQPSSNGPTTTSRNGYNNNKLDHAFSTFYAKSIALALVFSVYASEMALSYYENMAAMTFVLVTLWFAVLVSMGLFWLPNSKKYFWICVLNCLLLLGIPRLEDLRSLLPVCGVIAAASVICVCRALTVMFNPDAFAKWPAFRFFYYFCVFGTFTTTPSLFTHIDTNTQHTHISGWHDFRIIRPATKPKKTIRMLMWKQIRAGGMVLFAVYIIVKSGQPSLMDLEVSSVLRLVAHVLLRGLFGTYAFYNSFVSLDSGMRLQYVRFLGIDVDSAFGSIIPRKELGVLGSYARKCTANCDSVAMMWGLFWNKPVNRLLVDGVYNPLKGKIPKFACAFVVFAVSGFGHLYACNATGLPLWIQTCMFSFFMVQPMFIFLQRNISFLRGPVWTFFFLISSAPLFTESLLYLFGLGIRVSPELKALAMASKF